MVEAIIRKYGIYGFVLGLAVSVLIVNYKEVQHLGNNVTTTTYKPVFDYVVTILRSGFLGMLLGFVVGWNVYKKKQSTDHAKTYYIPFFLVIFIIALILNISLSW